MTWHDDGIAGSEHHGYDVTMVTDNSEIFARVARPVARRYDCDISFPVNEKGETEIVFSGNKEAVKHIVEEAMEQLGIGQEGGSEQEPQPANSEGYYSDYPFPYDYSYTWL